MGKPKLERTAEGIGDCAETGCDHVVRYAAKGRVYCACHIPISEVRVKSKMLSQAIDYAALEHPDFRIDGEGNISLEE